MIVIKLMGGLGNQLLQYAVGRHLAIKNKSSLYLDLSWFENHKNDYPRDFRLDRFHTRYKIADVKQLLWRLRYAGRFESVNPFKLRNVTEKNYFSYDDKVLEAGNNVLLNGFFSSYRYFEDIRDLLVQELQPVIPMDAKNAACLERIKNSNSVSVHIRRGDYMLTDFHGILPKNYYSDAIRYLAEKTGPLRLFIFSDEPDWVGEHMHFEYPYELIVFNKDEKNYFDMQLMKYCKHNIIANSTFSWWPAWLNENPRKIVVAPEKWFSQGVSTNALVPREWIRIK